MSREKIKVAVGLLTGYTTLTAHMFQPGCTPRHDCRRCRDEEEDTVHVVCHCPVLACKRYRTLGSRFLKTKDLGNMSVNGIMSLAANTLTPF
jgi:hypothetical protein